MHRIVWLCVCLLVGVSLCEPLKDPDLWWHITVGEWILAHFRLPSVELWNQFALDTPWRAYSWLAEVVFAGAWLEGGYQGLLILKLFCCVFLVGSFSYAFGKLARDHFVGAVLGVFTAAACFSHLTLRPQSFVWALFALLFPLLQNIREKGLERRSIASMLLLFCVWANLHITTVLGLVSVVAWLWSGRQDTSRALRAAGVAFVGTLITPHFGAEWLTFFTMTSHPAQHRAIAEFQPATILQFSTGFLLIGLTLWATVIYTSRVRVETLRFLHLGGFVLASLAVVKFLPFAMVILAALLGLSWRESLRWGSISEALDKLRMAFEKIPREGLAFLLICLSIVKIFGLWKEPVDLLLTPVQAYDFIEKHQLPQPILLGFGQGGYAMLRQSNRAGEPAYTVPIDGRTNVVPHHVWDAFMSAFTGKNNWQDYFDLVKPNTVLWKTESPLSSLLLLAPEWCEVYRSGRDVQGFAVYVRREVFEEKRSQLDSADCGRNPALQEQLRSNFRE